MKLIFLLLFITTMSEARVVEDFLKTQELSENGNYDGTKQEGLIKLMVRNLAVHAHVDFVHVEGKNYVISLHDIKLVKSTGPIVYAGYPVYSTLILTPAELGKRGQKFQSYGAISSEEGNSFCRAAFGSEYHLVKQNPTASRKTEIDSWFLESVTCEGPRETSLMGK
jgi:hypothetical protein